ncbi:MAG: TetR/AcrR family transcriptional regulator [Bacteroidales bacterium]|nr:TetR/AcrR family transcriptional regulator [Bacteroidales bacterium]
MEVKDRIILEFTRQFKEKKVKDIKVDDVAKMVGISKRTLYENFENKEVLIKEALCYTHSQELKKIESNCIENENPLLRVLTYMEQMTAGSCQISFTHMDDLRQSYPEISSILMQQHIDFINSFVIKAIKDSQEEGYIFKTMDPELLLVLMSPRGFDRERGKRVKYYNNMYDMALLFVMHAYVVLRGVSTEKGRVVCDNFMEKQKEKIMKRVELHGVSKE